MQPEIATTPISFWAREPSPLTHYKSTSRLPSNADIVIIGSGFAGASVAHHLEYENRTVVMLESRDLCSGASGRNGGHLAPNYLSDQVEFELMNVAELMKVIEEFDFLKDECYVHRGMGYYIFETDDSWKHAQKRLAELGRMGIQVPARLVDGALVKHELGVADKWPISGALVAPTSPINPYKLVDFLIQRAVARGLNLYTNTRATRLETKNGRTRIETNEGVITTNQVILATNAYTGSISNVFSKDVQPVRGQVSRWSIPNEHLPLKLGDYKVSIGIGDEYLAVVPESDTRVSVILGGLRRYVAGAQVGIDDDNSIDATISRELKNKMQQITGTDFGDAVEEWTGIMGFTSSGVPYVGETTKGVVAVCGFGGHGMPRIFLSGRAVVECFVNGNGWPEWFPVEYRLNEA